jgi:gluconate 2-dehydrogenase gamma chain
MTPSHPGPGRRQFLQSIAAGAGAVWLSAAPDLLRASARAASQRGVDDPYRVLRAPEVAALDVLTELILPTDDTPGARTAQVVRFLDHALAEFAASELPLFRQGLVDVDQTARHRYGLDGFTALPPEAQVELLQSLETSGAPFFESLRTATLTGMFANPEYGGNYQKSGWSLIGFEDRFAWGPPFGEYDRE